MSHYTTVQTEFRNIDALIDALIVCGFRRDQIERHEVPESLRDYCGRATQYMYKDTGDVRFAHGDAAHVIVRARDLGENHNDFGVYCDGAKSVLFLCDYARGRGTENCANPVAVKCGGYAPWLKKLKQEYVVACAQRHANKVGKKLHRVQAGDKIHLYIGA